MPSTRRAREVTMIWFWLLWGFVVTSPFEAGLREAASVEAWGIPPPLPTSWRAMDPGHVPPPAESCPGSDW